MSVAEQNAQSVTASGQVRHCFTIENASQHKTYVFSTVSKDDCLDWITKLKSTISTIPEPISDEEKKSHRASKWNWAAAKITSLSTGLAIKARQAGSTLGKESKTVYRQMFGVYLKDIEYRDKRPIPYFLEQACDLVGRSTSTHKGIFRYLGPRSQLYDLITKVENDIFLEFAPEKHSPYLVATLVKTFVRCLKHSVIDQPSRHDSIIKQINQSITPCKSPSKKKLTSLVPLLQEIILSLPDTNAQILRCLIEMMANVASDVIGPFQRDGTQSHAVAQLDSQAISALWVPYIFFQVTSQDYTDDQHILEIQNKFRNAIGTGKTFSSSSKTSLTSGSGSSGSGSFGAKSSRKSDIDQSPFLQRAARLSRTTRLYNEQDQFTTAGHNGLAFDPDKEKFANYIGDVNSTPASSPYFTVTWVLVHLWDEVFRPVRERLQTSQAGGSQDSSAILPQFGGSQKKLIENLCATVSGLSDLFDSASIADSAQHGPGSNSMLTTTHDPRCFVRQGPLIKAKLDGKPQQRHFILFNDMLVWCAKPRFKATKQDGFQLQYRGHSQLRTALINDLSDNPSSGQTTNSVLDGLPSLFSGKMLSNSSDYNSVAFHFAVPALGKTWVIFPNSTQDKKLWLRDINRIIWGFIENDSHDHRFATIVMESRKQNATLGEIATSSTIGSLGIIPVTPTSGTPISAFPIHSTPVSSNTPIDTGFPHYPGGPNNSANKSSETKKNKYSNIPKDKDACFELYYNTIFNITGSKSFHKKLELERRLSGFDDSLAKNLKRRFIRDEIFTVIQNGKATERYLALFTDMLIVGKPTAIGKMQHKAKRSWFKSSDGANQYQDRDTSSDSVAQKNDDIKFEGIIKLTKDSIRVRDLWPEGITNENTPAMRDETLLNLSRYQIFRNSFEILVLGESALSANRTSMNSLTQSLGSISVLTVRTTSPLEKAQWLADLTSIFYHENELEQGRQFALSEQGLKSKNLKKKPRTPDVDGDDGSGPNTTHIKIPPNFSSANKIPRRVHFDTKTIYTKLDPTKRQTPNQLKAMISQSHKATASNMKNLLSEIAEGTIDPEENEKGEHSYWEVPGLGAKLKPMTQDMELHFKKAAALEYCAESDHITATQYEDLVEFMYSLKEQDLRKSGDPNATVLRLERARTMYPTKQAEVYTHIRDDGTTAERSSSLFLSENESFGSSSSPYSSSISSSPITSVSTSNLSNINTQFSILSSSPTTRSPLSSPLISKPQLLDLDLSGSSPVSKPELSPKQYKPTRKLSTTRAPSAHKRPGRSSNGTKPKPKPKQAVSLRSEATADSRHSMIGWDEASDSSGDEAGWANADSDSEGSNDGDDSDDEPPSSLPSKPKKPKSTHSRNPKAGSKPKPKRGVGTGPPRARGNRKPSLANKTKPRAGSKPRVKPTPRKPRARRARRARS